jgi:hypothetical protein
MSRTRSSRRWSGRKHTAERRRFVAGFTLFALALATAILFVSRPSRQPALAGEAGLTPASVAPDLPAVPAAVDREVYPYSIIAGGARSVDELKQAIAGDPVVAAHYADFDLENTHAVRLEQPKLAHVSYRIGNAVYWTRKPLLIGAGETVLTDGVRIARTRCGNQLAETPGEISPLEPAPDVLDTPLRFIGAAIPGGMLPLSAVQALPGASGGMSWPPLGGPLSGVLSGGGLLTSGSLPGAAGAAGTGPEAEQPANPVPASDDSGGGVPDDPGHPGGYPGIPSEFPVPPGGSVPPFGGPPNTPDLPKWLVPPETILPPGSEDLPPVLLHPDDPGRPQTPDVPELAPIPEPGTAVLMLGGVVAYVARRLKRKASDTNV